MIKIKRSFKDTRWIEYLILLVILFMFEIAISIRYNFGLEPLYYLLTFASISILPSLILFIKSSKVRFYLYIIFVILNLAIFVTDTCLFYYKKDVFALAMILDISDGITMGIKYNIFIAFNLWQWFLIFSIVIIGLIYLGYIMIGKNYRKSIMPVYYSVLIGLTCFILMFSSFIIKPSDRDIYKTPQDKRTYLITFGMSTFNQRDALDTVIDVILIPYQKIKARQNLDKIDKDDPSKETNVSGSLKGKNIIMIMMETGEDYAIDKTLTPTLYKILNDGYSFKNTYGVAARNYTYDAEFKSLTSMMYYDSGNLYQLYGNNSFTNALPYLLRENGYTANSFHSNTGTYFNRNNMHMALGFEKFYSGDEMVFLDSEFPRDSEMFSQMRDYIAPIQEKPFFSFITTYYTHGPYNKKREEINEFYLKIEEDGRFVNHEAEFINILASHMELDYALEIMVDDLKQKEILDDTMIVLFSDHKNYSSPEITDKYTKIEVTSDIYDYEVDKVPFAIYNPNIKERDINYITSQYDIMPTIADLLGITLIKPYYYGQSIFLYDTDEYEEKPIIFGYSSWIDKRIIIYDNEIIWVDQNLENVENYYLEIRAKVFGTIETFDGYLLTDYFKPKTAID